MSGGFDCSAGQLEARNEAVVRSGDDQDSAGHADWPWSEKLVLIATRADGRFLCFKVHLPITDEEIRRIEGLQNFPGLEDAVWTGRAGSSLR